MNQMLISALLATSVILIISFTLHYRRRRALERELSRLKNEELKKIEDFKKSELEKLNAEMRLKRLENDDEIQKNKQSVDKLLQDYKISRFQVIAAEIEKEQEEAINNASETAAELGAKLLAMFANVQLQQSKIDEFRRTQELITDALSRQALENEQYCLTLSEVDSMEIKELQNVAYKYSRIRPIILKAIYEIYYAPEVKKLVNRVVGNDRVSGIYRITCKVDGRTYIGKSVDIRERWITHFKRAAGVETETQNLLYPAMRSIGLEQFSFEVIERGVAEDMLSTREKYWQLFYDAKTHGFSVR